MRCRGFNHQIAAKRSFCGPCPGLCRRTASGGARCLRCARMVWIASGSVTSAITRSSLIEHLAFAQTGYFADLRISNIRFLMVMSFFALFYVSIMLQRDLYALIICYSAIAFYFTIAAAGRLLHVGAPSSNIILLIIPAAISFVVLLLLAREEKR